jgi:transposase
MYRVKKTLMRVAVRRIRCSECGASSHEPISFCPDPYVRYTKWAARFVLALRAEMSISAVSKFTGLHWETVKNIEKAWLEKKYKRIRLDEVAYLGIDEVYLGKRLGYITIVRDLDSGAVLFIGKGKGGDALEKFKKRIKYKAKQIKAVAIDMANSYSAWVTEVLPDADIVYDHFHVIKSMNDKLNSLRRTTMNQLEDDQKKELKGKRFLLLRNEETLSEDARKELDQLRERFDGLGLASAMKEYLRNIYKIAPDAGLAKRAFERWCSMADHSEIACLKTMAKTIRRRIQGLLAYWKYNGLTSASQEGFNNKIGWLTRQAYGYRDEHYLHLKIYDLPNLSTRRTL